MSSSQTFCFLLLTSAPHTFELTSSLPPSAPTPPSLTTLQPFTLIVVVAFIANERQHLSVLKTCTAYLCVGQRFKDEGLSAQRLYMHAFAFNNTEPDRHPRQECKILYISPSPCPFFDSSPSVCAESKITIQDVSVKYGRFKGIMMDQYFTHLYSYVHTSILTFFM